MRVVRQRMESEETSCPVTPKELGWRRAAGHMSDQDMMDRLRSWPDVQELLLSIPLELDPVAGSTLQEASAQESHHALLLWGCYPWVSTFALAGGIYVKIVILAYYYPCMLTKFS